MRWRISIQKNKKFFPINIPPGLAISTSRTWAKNFQNTLDVQGHDKIFCVRTCRPQIKFYLIKSKSNQIKFNFKFRN